MKGRKCRSIESWTVRRYIRQQFEEAGLAPWGASHGFDLSYGLGTNVVGVLPGTDRDLSSQIVLVCTHYDGRGVVKGRICPSAAESATGTAALVDLARRLSAGGRLKRSVAFAAFDCGEERYLGAFAFTCRKDFDPSKIAAVVDVDMLGRPLFGVLENTLLAIGATDSPALQRVVDEAAGRQKLRILEAGTGLAGPVGDYFAFQQWPIPCLFLTNGLYFDYGKPTDTADKVDYDLLESDTAAAADIIQLLARRDHIERLAAENTPSRQELRSIITVLATVRAKAAANDLTAGEIHMLGRLENRTRQLLAQPDYTEKDHDRLVASLVEQGAPSVIRFLYSRPKPAPRAIISGRKLADFLRLQHFFVQYPAFASRGMQQVVCYFTEGWTLLRLLGSYDYSACDIHADQIVCQEAAPATQMPQKTAKNRFRLSFLYPQMTVEANLVRRKMAVTWSAVDFRGDRAGAIDLCLVMWSNAPNCLNAVMPRVLREVAGCYMGDRLAPWLHWWLEETEAGSESAWLRGIWTTDNPVLLKALFDRGVAGKGLDVSTPRLVSIITDAQMRGDVRAEAIRALPAAPGPDALLALANMLGDRTRSFQYGWLPAFDPTYPFYENIIMQLQRRYPEPHRQPTLGHVAHEKLAALTGQDFGLDLRAWREWINRPR